MLRRSLKCSGVARPPRVPACPPTRPPARPPAPVFEDDAPASSDVGMLSRSLGWSNSPNGARAGTNAGVRTLVDLHIPAGSSSKVAGDPIENCSKGKTAKLVSLQCIPSFITPLGHRCTVEALCAEGLRPHQGLAGESWVAANGVVKTWRCGHS